MAGAVVETSGYVTKKSDQSDSVDQEALVLELVPFFVYDFEGNQKDRFFFLGGGGCESYKNMHPNEQVSGSVFGLLISGSRKNMNMAGFFLQLRFVLGFYVFQPLSL